MWATKLIRQLEEELAQDPTNVRLLQRLGELRQKMGDNPGAADAFARVAAVYERDGFLLKAVALSKQVLKLDPERNDLRFNLVELHAQLGLVSEAIGWLRVALQVATEQKDLESCLRGATRLAELDSTSARPRLYLAALLLQRGRKREAQDRLAEAVALLRVAHPELAVMVEQLALSPGPDATPEDLAALRQVRAEVQGRLDLDQAMLRVDFGLPN